MRSRVTRKPNRRRAPGSRGRAVGDWLLVQWGTHPDGSPIPRFELILVLLNVALVGGICVRLVWGLHRWAP